MVQSCTSDRRAYAGRSLKQLPVVGACSGLQLWSVSNRPIE